MKPLRVERVFHADKVVSLERSYVLRCAIWYHLYNLKNEKNTHGGVLILKPATLLKLALLRGCFSRFLNYTNGTKSRDAPHIFSSKYFHLKVALRNIVLMFSQGTAPQMKVIFLKNDC